MKRWVIALATVGMLVMGSVAVALAEDEDAPQDQSGWCGGYGASGSYDPATNPTIRRLGDKLGLSAADLAKELQSGKSIADVASARKVDLQPLVDLLVAPQKEMMQVAVKYGNLTQEQADQMLGYMADRTKAQLEQKGYTGFGGMMGGGYGMMGSGGAGMMGGRSGFQGGSGGFGGMMGGYGGSGPGGLGGMMSGLGGMMRGLFGAGLSN